MAKKKEYLVEVRRYYYVCDHIEVNATSKNKARELAEEISDNKDYTGQFQLDEVQTEIFD